MKKKINEIKTEIFKESSEAYIRRNMTIEGLIRLVIDLCFSRHPSDEQSREYQIERLENLLTALDKYNNKIVISQLDLNLFRFLEEIGSITNGLSKIRDELSSIETISCHSAQEAIEKIEQGRKILKELKKGRKKDEKSNTL